MNDRIINSLKKQKAVYWSTPVRDGFGKYTYADPVEIQVLWQDKQEKYLTDGVEEKVSRAVVLVDQDVVVKGMIALTGISDLSSSELPEDNSAYEIKAFAKIPDPRGESFSRKIWL